MQVAEQIKPMMADVGYALHKAHQAGAKLLFEGAQGTLLDIDHGTYPFVTSSNCVAGNAAAGTGLGPGMLHYILGITKAYTTRVGSGPFPTELDILDEGSVGHHLSVVGQERGTVTGRARRCGWLDAAALKRAIIINGISGLCITKLDVLDGLAEIKVCIGYKLDGQDVDILPSDADDVGALRAGLRDVPGLVGEDLRPDRVGPAAAQRAPLPRARQGADRRADRHGVHRPGPRPHHPAAPPVPLNDDPARCAPAPEGLTPAPRSGRALAGDTARRITMLTDDGKHLYISWDEYHQLIERLALKVHALGLAVRPDPVPGARRHAPGRHALAHLRQAAGHHVHQLVSRRGRHDPGPARHGQVHHAAARRARRAACCWWTTWPTPA